MSMEFKVRTWLWVVLAAVVLIGGGLTWWYVKSSKDTTTSTSTSPTPVKSATISPKSSVSPTATTGKTATPTPAQTPPTGWKIEEKSLLLGRNVSSSGKYKVFVKNSWTAINAGDVSYPTSTIAYAENSTCKETLPGHGIEQSVLNTCSLFYVSIGKYDSMPSSTSSTYYYPAKVAEGIPGVAYMKLIFTPQISEADKKIVLDSFQSL